MLQSSNIKVTYKVNYIYDFDSHCLLFDIPKTKLLNVCVLKTYFENTHLTY